MSRRDIIILAVLLNTGLLAVLFVMAMNPDDDRLTDHIEIPSAIVEAPKLEPIKEAPPVVLAHENKSDEVDNVLKDFAATIRSEPAEVVKETPVERRDTHIAMASVKEKPQPTRQEKKGSGNYVEVTVKSGDILGRIAQANNTTVSSIKRANNLTTDRLKVGQILKVPVNTKKTKVASSRSNSLTDDGFTRFYTVQNGDNPWKIAKKYNVSVKEFLRMNDLDEAKARSLRPGDRVRVQ